ncbi:hypothetical protein CAEBREN_24185 [Caenorhabditis brenneri]|uniref:Uncharacterized protein n=1 Tax=Caenorhabditis brenneri TaxID=135651 RepID=G0P7P9_CAEBE|nr:hypothetical protein CAEBREN_24185 [Caenorhabditis brenneri]
MAEFYEHIQMLYEVGYPGYTRKVFQTPKREHFKLPWLPVLAKKEVVRSMDIKEIVANPMKQRKYPIMGVVREKDEIHLYSSGKDQPIRCDYFVAEAFELEYEILMILNKKKELEEKLERIQNLLETNQDQNMIKKKTDISRELQSVSVELDNYKLVLRDGIYRYT